jgi:hypothetical protein
MSLGISAVADTGDCRILPVMPPGVSPGRIPPESILNAPGLPDRESPEYLRLRWSCLGALQSGNDESLAMPYVGENRVTELLFGASGTYWYDGSETVRGDVTVTPNCD